MSWGHKIRGRKADKLKRPKGKRPGRRKNPLLPTGYERVKGMEDTKRTRTGAKKKVPMERPAPTAVSSLKKKAVKSPIVLSSGANVTAARIKQPASRALYPIALSLSEPTTKSCSSDGATNRVKNFSFECTNETRSREPLVS